MSQSVNIRAVQWAYGQEGLSVTAKGVLMTFAIHANERGYTWPGVDHIAFIWGMDRKTVRRQIERLLVRRLIFRTKKRIGVTGQVKVYRLPKVTYGSGSKSTRLQNDETGAKESLKSPTSGGKFPPNNDNNRTKNKNHDKCATSGNSIPAISSDTEIGKSGFVFEDYQNHNQPARCHVKFREFATWCRRKGGQPTEKGFWKWLRGQKPQWRNKVSKDFYAEGYELNGKFLTAEEAIQMGREDPELLLKFRRVTKHGDKSHIINA